MQQEACGSAVAIGERKSYPRGMRTFRSRSEIARSLAALAVLFSFFFNDFIGSVAHAGEATAGIETLISQSICGAAEDTRAPSPHQDCLDISVCVVCGHALTDMRHPVAFNAATLGWAYALIDWRNERIDPSRSSERRRWHAQRAPPTV